MVRAGAAAAVVLVVALVGCGDVRLVDPTAVQVDLSGWALTVHLDESAAGGWLDVQGFAYGFREVGEDVLVRYLDVGDLWVGGLRTSRTYLRPGEPVYLASGPYDAKRPVLDLRALGSARMPRCELAIPMPSAALPEEGVSVRRTSPLAVPLSLSPGGPGSIGRVALLVMVAAADGSMIRIEGDDLGSGSLVVPARLLAGLPAGSAVLTIRLDWQQSTGAGSSAQACAPAFFARNSYSASRRLSLE